MVSAAKAGVARAAPPAIAANKITERREIMAGFLLSGGLLEHFPEKWVPVFRKKMRQKMERLPIPSNRKTLQS
jgi:hypothetical protein